MGSQETPSTPTNHLPLLLSVAAANCFPTVAPTYASPLTNRLPLTPSAVASSRFQFHRSRTTPVIVRNRPGFSILGSQEVSRTLFVPLCCIFVRAQKANDGEQIEEIVEPIPLLELAIDR
ncbi:unnamed protein product [Linum trigynum]|uniref:Uncharacterized protein n=1 Tax=Linum trigynum TaxID=586398 RepID=A0AAV2F630_9ROSI